jgi:hypothetical protein
MTDAPHPLTTPLLFPPVSGPWFSVEWPTEPNRFSLVGQDADWIASVQMNGRYLPEVQRETVRMMAATPELVGAAGAALFVLRLVQARGEAGSNELGAIAALEDALRRAGRPT